MPARLTREGDLLVLSISGLSGAAFSEALGKAKAIEGRRYNPENKTWEWPADPMVANRLIHSIQPELGPDVEGWVEQALAASAEEVTTRLPKVAVGDLRTPRAADLFEHQRDAVGFIAQHPHPILADDMGLGKTVESIIAIEEFYLRNPDHPRRRSPRLVIVPTSMMGKWAEEEIPAWSEHPVYLIDNRKPGPKRAAALREALAQPGPVWIVVNWEQIRAQKVKLSTEDRTAMLDELREAGQLTREDAQRIKRNKYAWRMKEPLFKIAEWGAVIADEAQRAKNKDSQQTRGLWQITAPVQIAATGTPIQNSPDEIWALLAWQRPEQYAEYHKDKTGYWAFYETYVQYYEGAFGKIVTGIRNPDKLRFELSDKLVRRTKGEVLDMPPKLRTRVPVRLTPKQRRLYDEAKAGLMFEIETELGEAAAAMRAGRSTEAQQRMVQEALAALERGDGLPEDYLERYKVLVPNAAAKMTRLRQIVSTPALLGGPDESAKLDAAVEIASDHPEKPFVFFTYFRGTADILAERLRKRKFKVGVISGATPMPERTRIVREFQAGELDHVVGTIGAAGVGLTLTRSDTAIFIERDWVPAINEQAEDRLHRIGQTEQVTILILEASATIDRERIAPTNRLKELIVGSVIAQDAVQTTER